MPTWNSTKDEQESTELRDILLSLDKQVTDDPSVSMEAVAGISMEELIAHAGKAVAAIAERHDDDFYSLPTMMRIYSMGFIIGTKYGAEHGAPSTSD